jgi:hypothetical protein
MNARHDWGEAIAREISHSIARKIAIGIAFFLAFLLFLAVGGVVVQLLWNWLVPGLFNVRAVTFWEALGLLALCRILFGGFGKGGGPRSHRRVLHRRGHEEWWKTRMPRDSQGGSDTSGPGTVKPDEERQ